MAQAEMTFAQALTEAKQIIVQQSNRIKNDLEKIKSLQETVASQTSALAVSERTIREQADALARHDEQLRALTARLTEASQARDQAETIIDRQGQRLTQAQATITGMEKQVAELSQRINQLTHHVGTLQQQLPTQEDEQALEALSTLLSTTKVSMPAAGSNRPAQPMRMAEAA
jgi:chromosome segregation ATPase